MYNYPKAPENVNPSIAEPSLIYKKEVTKSIIAIILFIVGYIALIGAAAFLSYLCIKLGLGIMSIASHLLVLIAGGGVILIGLLVFYFVLKFVFSSFKTDVTGLKEITESDQPELYNFIKKITEETQAPFPKKIYLSNEVNASVFYDSSFWSMFLPVRKNLLIGLGLVNSVSISEFKAILAHEFGHFSQKSMKIGSYVYNANRIIHNLLYDNHGFYKTLNRIASVHLVLYLCMSAVSGLVRAIQFLLTKMYLFVNKQNMKLSREMEFHADSVAALVSGSKPLISSLYRLELAEASFTQTLSICNLLLDDKKQEQNLYPNHKFIMNQIATEKNISITHDLPTITADTFSDFDTTNVNIENQWASHPSTADRETALLALNIPSQEVHESAWQLFVNPEDLQKEMTVKIYEDPNLKTTNREVGNFVQTKYLEQMNHFELPARTKGYWDDKQIPTLDFDGTQKDVSIEDVYDKDILDVSKKLHGLQQDINLLEGIMKKEIVVSSFDYKGEKYAAKYAETILNELKFLSTDMESKIENGDKNAMQMEFLLAQKHNKESEFMTHYKAVLEAQQKGEEFVKLYNEILIPFQPLFQGMTVSVDEAREMVMKVMKKEQEIKNTIQFVLQNQVDSFPLKSHTLSRLNSFNDSIREYFIVDTFQDTNIQALLSDLDNASLAFNEWIHAHKKMLFQNN